MAINSRPGGQIIWASNVLNNSPNGGPSREAYDSRFGLSGWVYGEKLPYQVFNEWQYNIYQNMEWAADSILQHEEDIAALGGGVYVDDSLTISGGVASIPFTTHNISNPIVQLQDSNDAIVDAEIIVDRTSFDITIQNATNGTYRIVVR